MGTNIMLWKYILKDQNESNITYLILLLNNNNCEKKAKIMYKWYFELLFICIQTNNINKPNHFAAVCRDPEMWWSDSMETSREKPA